MIVSHISREDNICAGGRQDLSFSNRAIAPILHDRFPRKDKKAGRENTEYYKFMIQTQSREKESI